MQSNRSYTLLLILLAIQTAAIVVFWTWQFFARHAVEPYEVSMLVNALWWKSGHPPYTHLAELPVIQNPYGPVFQWLWVVLPSFEAQPYLVGRAISVLSILGIAIAAAVWLRREKAPWAAVAVAIMLIFASKPWILFGPLGRVDALAVLLSVVGLLLVVAYRSRLGLAAALTVFTIAVSVKLTALAAPATAVLYLWMVDRRRSIAFALAAAVLLPGSVLVLQWATDGAYLFNASFGNEPTHVLKAIELPARSLISLFWLIGLAVAIRRLGLPKGSASSAAAIYAAVSLGVAAVFSLNPLSSWNYLMELYVALGLLTGFLITRLHDDAATHDRPSRTPVFLAVHAAVALVVSLSVIAETRGEVLDYRERYEAAHEQLAPLVRDGREVLILDSQVGKDALAGLGQANAVSVPKAVEARPEIQSLIRRLAVPGFDLILTGDRLIPLAYGPEANGE